MSRIEELERVLARAAHLLEALDTNDESDDILYDAVVEGIEIRKGQLEELEAEQAELLRQEHEATEREGWEAYQAR